jgi:hypothetical protein
MPTYNITLTAIQDQALTWKATQLGKTKGQIFDDFVIDGIIAYWIREMFDLDVSPLQKKWDSLTQAQRDQIKTIAGV